MEDIRVKRSMKITGSGFLGSYFEFLKRSLASIAVFGILTIQAYADESKETTVTISPVVQEQIQQASPDERKKIEAAINLGNRFVPHHFDGSAYARNDEQEIKIWLKNIRPMINRDDPDWYTPEGVFDSSTSVLEINGKKATFEVVCPQIELISVNARDDHFELNYRTKIIGMWKTSSVMFTEGDIQLDEKEEFDEVHIGLNKSNKVSQVASKFAVYPTIPKLGIDMFAAFIKRPYGVFVDSASGVIMEPQSSINAKVARYKQYIELIKNEETVACKGFSSTFKQPFGKE